MAKSRFKVTFEGEEFDGGEIDVRDLAPTLLALGELVQAANHALNGDRAAAQLKVAATDKGCFVALLAVDVSWLADMLDTLSAHSDRMVAADQLVELLLKVGGGIGTGVFGVIGAVRFLRGRRPDSIEPKGDGTTSIVVNGTAIIVQDQTVALLRDVRTREAIESLGKRARNVAGLKRLKFDDGSDTEPLELERKDFEVMRVPEPSDDAVLEVSRRVAWLQVVSVHFQGGYKWRFSDGGERPFTAEMEDQVFRERVQRGDLALNANDKVRCRLREEQVVSSGSALTKTAYVEEVLDYRESPRQIDLI